MTDNTRKNISKRERGMVVLLKLCRRNLPKKTSANVFQIDALKLEI